MPSPSLHRTLGNAAVLTLGAAVETGLQFAFIVIAGRELGPAEFGFYGYLISILTVAVTIAHFGLPVVAVREFAQKPQDEESLFAATFRIRASFSILFFVTAVVAAAFVPQSNAHCAAAWAMFAYLLFIPFDLSPVFDARKLSRWDVPGKTAGRAAALIVLIVLWQSNDQLTVLDAALASSTLLLVNVVVGWIVARRLGFDLRPFATTTETRGLALTALPIMWSNVMTVIYLQSQTIVVKWLSTELQTGFYALANRLLIPVLIFRGILYRLLLPILSDVGRDRTALTSMLERVLPALALIFMPLTALAIPAAEVFIVPVFGGEYSGAVLPFQISVSFLFFTGMSSALGVSLLASGDARTPTVGLTLGCAVSVGVSMMIIPTYGANGAAWSAFIGEIIANVYTLPKFLKLVRPKVLKRLIGISTSSLLGLLLYYGLTMAVGVVPELALTTAILVVLAGLWITGEISQARLRVMKDLVARRGG